jgi:hypothetical protein
MAFLPLVHAPRLRGGFRHLEDVWFAAGRVFPSGNTHFGAVPQAGQDQFSSTAQGDPLSHRRIGHQPDLSAQDTGVST